MGNNMQNCLLCRQYDHWIEIRLMDEHAQPFKGTLNGTLRANDGVSHSVRFQDGYLLKTGLPAGPVQIAIPTDELLKAAYTHAPREKGKTNPVPDFAKKDKGYEGHDRQYQNITVGDIWSAPPKQHISDRHQPRATGKKAVLVVDNSYVLEVRAFNLLTVRIGMFFDGTGNNSYNADLAKERTSIWSSRCEKRDIGKMVWGQPECR